jgi:hypothetical protein
MSAEPCGATGAEVAESLPLAIRQSVAPALEKLLLVLTKDLGDGGPRLAHGCGCSAEGAIDRRANVSRGLAMACKHWVDTRK